MDTKDAERAYPETVDETHRGWLHSKPFRNDPAETSRLLVDAALIILVLDLRDGVSLCELGCGTGWLSRLAARQGVRAVGYDISAGMVEIAREEAAREGVDVRYEVADMETLEPDEQFDTCLLYDALHQARGRASCSPRPARRSGPADACCSTSRTGCTASPAARPRRARRHRGRLLGTAAEATRGRGRIHGGAPPPPDAARPPFECAARRRAPLRRAARHARDGPVLVRGLGAGGRRVRTVVTGGAGFIGSHVSSAAPRGDEVTVIDNFATGKRENLRSEAALAERDMREDLGDVFDDARPEVCFHLAAQADVRDSVADPGSTRR